MRLCTMYGLPTHLVQKLNVGTVRFSMNINPFINELFSYSDNVMPSPASLRKGLFCLLQNYAITFLFLIIPTFSEDGFPNT